MTAEERRDFSEYFRIYGQGIFSDAPGFSVHVKIHPRAKRCTARWRDAEMAELTVPPTITISQIEEVWERLRERMLRRRPQQRRLYAIGDVHRFDGLEVEIVSDPVVNHVSIRCSELPYAKIIVGGGLDVQSPAIQALIGRGLRMLAKRLAPALLLPLAKEVSEQLGVQPKGWKISTGFRVLGTCSRGGVISLSYALAFYPQEVRKYIVCHELSHLSEFNHSPRFHQICDGYCRAIGLEPESVMNARMNAAQRERRDYFS